MWDVAGTRIGVGICWDQWYPESARVMALMGAELLFYPTAIGSEPQAPDFDTHRMWRRAMVGHAVSNCMPVIAANRIGDEGGQTFYGHSFITNEWGDLVAHYGREETGALVAELDLDSRRAPPRQHGLLPRPPPAALRAHLRGYLRHRYLIALGSNRRHHRFGRPRDVLAAALEALEREGIKIIAAAPVLLTDPVGPSIRRYANAAAVIETKLRPFELLAALKRIERAFGRRPEGQRWSARVLDLDIVAVERRPVRRRRPDHSPPAVPHARLRPRPGRPHRAPLARSADRAHRAPTPRAVDPPPPRS